MQFSFFASLSVLLTYCIVFSAAASPDCFTRIGNGSTTTSDVSARVTTGLICSISTCETTLSGYVNESSTLDITTSHTAEVLETMGTAFNVPFNEVKFEAMGGRWMIGRGQTGYISYDYSLLCYEGVIEKDCFDDIPVGTPVMACRPRNTGEDPNGPNYRDGRLTFVETDEATAQSMTDNPALAVELPDADDSSTNNISDTTIYNTPESGAINLLGQGSWQSSLLTVTMLVAVMTTGNYIAAI